MSVAGRGLLAAFTLCLTLLGGCSGGGGGARECTTTEACAAGSRCQDGTCVANHAPVARLAIPSGAEAFAIVTLDGSASSDPDPGDTVASHTWRVVPVDAACAGPTIAGTTASARARFACPGRFAVELTVVDALGAASEPAVQEVVVLPSTAAPLLTAAADVVAGHRCAGDPLICTVDAPGQAVALGATSGAALPLLRWIAVPPEGLALDAARRVTFDPSPGVLAPAARIETDGVAIAGDWVFRVEAYDDLGVLGSASMRVSVGNSPPVIEGAPSPVPHLFDAAASRFTASGEIGVLGYDPDGDPLVRQVSSRAVNHGPATFNVVDLGDRLTFSIQVPYGAPSDAAYLIGGAGLERSISMELQDPNGSVARETWAVVVENQPPSVAALASAAGAPHRFDAQARRYVATASASRWLDPEGDPLFAAAPTGDPVCPDLSFRQDGTAELSCGAAFSGTPALDGFVGNHYVSVLPRDPWAAAPAPSPTRVFVENRAPVAVPQVYSVSLPCQAGSCCLGIPSACDEYYTEYGAATVPASGFVQDPDGDPLLVVSGIDSTICEPPACALDLKLASGRTCSPSGDAAGVVSFTASDGALGVTGDVSVGIACVW